MKIAPSKSIQRCKPILGTYVEVSLTGRVPESELIQISEDLFKELERIHNLMSFHDEGSELSLINQNAHQEKVLISADTYAVLNQAIEMSKLSDGFYDVTIASAMIDAELLPNHIDTKFHTGNWSDIELTQSHIYFKKPLAVDLGGIAKGYAVDCALALCPRSIDATINAGGDISMNQWLQKSVTIRMPLDGFMIGLEIPMEASSVATSGSYFHTSANPILCPYSKESIPEENSVTVFAPNCMIADALTKVVFLAPLAREILDHLKAKAYISNDEGELMEFQPVKKND